MFKLTWHLFFDCLAELVEDPGDLDAWRDHIREQARKNARSAELARFVRWMSECYVDPKILAASIARRAGAAQAVPELAVQGEISKEAAVPLMPCGHAWQFFGTLNENLEEGCRACGASKRIG